LLASMIMVGTRAVKSLPVYISDFVSVFVWISIFSTDRSGFMSVTEAMAWASSCKHNHTLTKAKVTVKVKVRDVFRV
jgi:hypothetical protein